MSPSRRKRGTFGRTISSLTDCTCFEVAPDSSVFEIAWTQIDHDVTESGTVKSIVAEPSAPVRSCGCQNAVSEKFDRGGAAAGGAVSLSAALLPSGFPSASARRLVERAFSFFPPTAASAGGGGAAAGAGADLRSAIIPSPSTSP